MKTNFFKSKLYNVLSCLLTLLCFLTSILYIYQNQSSSLCLILLMPYFTWLILFTITVFFVNSFFSKKLVIVFQVLMIIFIVLTLNDLT